MAVQTKLAFVGRDSV